MTSDERDVLQQIRTQFHELWTNNVGKEGYEKNRWCRLSLLIDGLLADTQMVMMPDEPFERDDPTEPGHFPDPRTAAGMKQGGNDEDS